MSRRTIPLTKDLEAITLHEVAPQPLTIPAHKHILVAALLTITLFLHFDPQQETRYSDPLRCIACLQMTLHNQPGSLQPVECWAVPYHAASTVAAVAAAARHNWMTRSMLRRCQTLRYGLGDKELLAIDPTKMQGTPRASGTTGLRANMGPKPELPAGSQ